MPKFAANLTMLFNEHDFLDRFEAAARAGFDAVEFLFPYPYPAAELRARLEQAAAAGLVEVTVTAWREGAREQAVTLSVLVPEGGS